MPADFFRTMEDASGVDLDWFWRGWFYSTDHVDISLDSIKKFTVDSKDQKIEGEYRRALKGQEPESITDIRNRSAKRRVEDFPELKDFYNDYDEFTVSKKDITKSQKEVEKLKEHEKALLKNKDFLYQLSFSNLGGLVMPVILQVDYDNGEKELLRLPAEVWRMNPKQMTKTIVTPHEIVAVTLDPYWETADVDTYNNHFPRKPYESKLDIFKRKRSRNLMKDMTELEEDEDNEGEVVGQGNTAIGPKTKKQAKEDERATL